MQRRFLWLSLALVVILLLAAHGLWLRWLGQALIHADRPQRAQAVVVLAGDWTGDRVLKGGELVRQGYAPFALVSGPMQMYGRNEAVLAIEHAIRSGYPQDYFVPLYYRAYSTEEEAALLRSELERRGIRDVLVVTSDFHTARAGRILRRALGAAVRVRMIAVADRFFHPDSWWRNRQGRKTLFFEWSKTIATVLGV
ncbi:MAG: YdcF family protein [Acidobacteria bacterium]|nr:YdcF family protein [Acidobacteriota bacterium]MBI3281780.1 YdcF family protein [Acidobacteriota bacterium]